MDLRRIFLEDHIKLSENASCTWFFYCDGKIYIEIDGQVTALDLLKISFFITIRAIKKHLADIIKL